MEDLSCYFDNYATTSYIQHTIQTSQTVEENHIKNTVTIWQTKQKLI